MERKLLVKKYFQRSNKLTLDNPTYRRQVVELFHWMLKADEASQDVSKILQITKNATATVLSKQNGVIAGIDEIVYLLTQYSKLTVVWVNKRKNVKKSEKILEVKGTINELLLFERVILNILGRMSGIATLTHSLHNFSVSATRKTPWMLFDKKAVAVGGGLTHRLSLSDFVLIKDNHLELLKRDAIKKMIAKGRFFEIEVQTLNQAYSMIKMFEDTKNAQSFVFAIMLDNFTPKTATEFVKQIQKNPIYQNIIIEASGEITKKNFLVWKKTGVDILSLGSLTHSAPTFNLSMKID